MTCCCSKKIEIDITIPCEDIDLDIRLNDAQIDLEIEEGVGGRLPNYKGPYDVIPKVYEQKLETANKSMEDDVLIEKIPYSETANSGGGTTVNIAFIK